MSNITGDAALLEDEGVWWLQEASGTPPDGRRATDTRHTLSGGVGGISSVPREVTFTCEQFVNFLSHLLTQLAYGTVAVCQLLACNYRNFVLCSSKLLVPQYSTQC